MLHQLTFFPTLFPVNCYIYEESDELTLIDAALPGSAQAIQSVVTKLQKPLTTIVLTHAHSDHIGALEKLSEAYPNASICMSERDARLLKGDRSTLPGEPEDSVVRGGLPKQMIVRPDRLINEGDRIGSFEVVSSPGHTPGSISLWNKASRQLIVGDAFQVRGGVAVSGVLKLRFPFPALATWHGPTALQSAQRLLSLKPELLAVGHGSMVREPYEKMKKAVAQGEAKWGGAS
ncbi:MBL fold metallo-hydrolase [Bacillaceae bacterium SIJ1]|nr:MBL fold metallo-hydrolase [Litoribacterium kuwaitense]